VDTAKIIMSNNNNPQNNNGGYDARRYPLMSMPPRGFMGRYPPPPHPSMMMHHLGIPPPPFPQSHKKQNKATPRANTSSGNDNKGIPVSQAMGKVRPPYVKKSSGVKWTKEEVCC